MGRRVLVLGETRSASTALALAVSERVEAVYFGEFLNPVTLEDVEPELQVQLAYGLDDHNLLKYMTLLESEPANAKGFVYLLHFSDFGLRRPRANMPGELPDFVARILPHFTHVLCIMRRSRLDRFLSELRMRETGVHNRLLDGRDLLVHHPRGLVFESPPPAPTGLSLAQEWADRLDLDAVTVSMQLYWESVIARLRATDAQGTLAGLRYEDLFLTEGRSCQLLWDSVWRFLGLVETGIPEVPTTQLAIEAFPGIRDVRSLEDVSRRSGVSLPRGFTPLSLAFGQGM